ncbi:hypothetical protein H6G80_28455 [Nostoc sp. FACHB-87]|uniref:hypothetical protein n=1 Tax=Nostocaceae TaxID=1162 RepID=UPI001682ED7D|nr:MULTISPECIES: hypothetical protein [Nostocaceae]MBD2457984.1 hypothetical protein [Nostoc sp. FACHB-87]MBD2479239.1 hypothetical protein [Anabaena sp. FACHB-83]
MCHQSEFKVEFQLFVNRLEKDIKGIWDAYNGIESEEKRGKLNPRPALGSSWINSQDPNSSYYIQYQAKEVLNRYGINDSWVLEWVSEIILVARNSPTKNIVGFGRVGTYEEVLEVVRAWEHYFNKANKLNP